MLKRFSIGTGDRFGRQGSAQLRAVIKAKKKLGLDITPVWNKSYREHQIIGTGPKDVRAEADRAVKSNDWDDPYLVDADHITLKTVDSFLDSSDFFTLDVADKIGEEPVEDELKAFLKLNQSQIGELKIEGINTPFNVTGEFLEEWAGQYLMAVKEAGKMYGYISSQKKGNECVYEVSIDEVESPQSPLELYFLLKTLAAEGVNINTIAPKFTGNFFKGVDYEGDIKKFKKEFEEDLLVISHAIDEFNLPENLKLSVHSGSDKFSLYPIINVLLIKYKAGVHLKTSGTTWLEEVIGLAGSGDDGLKMVQTIYKEAYSRYEELTIPYKTVINIDLQNLPKPSDFKTWDGPKVAETLEHNPDHPEFDSQLRQFFHCSYKIAAEQGDNFLQLLDRHKESINERVTFNLYSRHIQPLFSGVE